MKRFIFVLMALFLFGTSSVYAGFLQFPATGYTSSNAPVTAVMDHNSSWNYIETYTGETGSYWDGCLAYVNGQNVACDVNTNADAPWAYKRLGGATWSTPGLNYNDDVCDDYPTCSKYMWYDNHRGYDFAVPQWTSIGASAAGTIVEINGTWGQITIDHGNGYRTTYTHMYLNLPLPQTVSKGERIGWVSDVAPVTVYPHLHFVVKRSTGGLWYLVDPYGGSGEPVLWE